MKKTKKAECGIKISYGEIQEIDISVKEILEHIEYDKEYEIKDILIEKDKKDKHIKILVKLENNDKNSKDKSLDKYLGEKQKWFIITK